MRSRRKQPRKKAGRKGIYLLPNLFTSASLFGGFYAIIASIQGRYEAAAIAVLVSMLFDGLDGKIARLTNTTSDFGTQYDSLSDLVAFGIAPSILTFQWALAPLGRLGWLACFTYVVCGALRLARFNVQKNTIAAKDFKGLPTPAAASFVASFVLFTTVIGGSPESKNIVVILLIYILSFLMVSNIRYPSFKEFDLKRQKSFNALVAIILVILVIVYKPKVMLFAVLSVYILWGPSYTLYRLRKKRPIAKTHVKQSPPVDVRDDLEGAENGGVVR
jgi:CDP-diacylglycerol--serine O-phosphatidyltransferase